MNYAKSIAEKNTILKKRPDLVLGYVEERCEEVPQERLYFVTPSGDVYQSDWFDVPNHQFDKRGRRWTKVDDLPPKGKFCGHYPCPAVARSGS